MREEEGSGGNDLQYPKSSDFNKICILVFSNSRRLLDVEPPF